jgi:hypothetical protein
VFFMTSTLPINKFKIRIPNLIMCRICNISMVNKIKNIINNQYTFIEYFSNISYDYIIRFLIDNSNKQF